MRAPSRIWRQRVGVESSGAANHVPLSRGRDRPARSWQFRLGPGSDTTMRQTFTADLAKALAAFGFERTILIGHSWGAETAIRFAAANPARWQALVIVDFGPELAQTGVDEVIKGFNRNAAQLRVGGRICALAGRAPSAGRTQIARRNSRATACAKPPACNTRSRSTRRSALNRSSAGWSPKTAAIISRALGRAGADQMPEPRHSRRHVRRFSHRRRGAHGRAHVAGQPAGNISVAGHAVMMDNPAEFSSSVEGF